MENGTAGQRRNPQEVDAVALWRARANRQAQRADRLEQAFEEVERVLETFRSRAFEVENDDRLFCEDCGRRGWPEDGFHAVEDDEVGLLSFCAEHWEATP